MPLRKHGAALALIAIIAVAAGLRAWAGALVHGPWIQVDETIYAKLGLDLWHHGSLNVLGGPTGFYSLLYPAFAGIPLALGGMRDGAEALRLLQAVTVALTAVPVYLWARTLSPRRWALAAAALALAPAGLAYTGMLMTEALFYPLLACACWAIARALERPGLGRGALAVAAVGLCSATRLQAVVLVPAALTAAVLLAVSERRLDALRRFVVPAGALGLAAVGWAGWRVAAGKPLLGSYEAAVETSYGAGPVARYTVYHVADLLLVTGVFPLAATVLLGVVVLKGRVRDPRTRAAAVTALSVSVWVIVQVGAFASVHVGYVAERNVFTLAPVLCVGLAAWVGAGAPRPRLATPLVVAAGLAACATLPLQRLLTAAAMPYAPSSMGPLGLLGGQPEWAQRAAVWGSAAVALGLLWLLPRRALWVLPMLAVAVLAAGSVQSSRYVAAQASLQQQRFLGPDPEWVDRAAQGPVAYLYDGDPDWDGVWANLYWNSRITHVVDLPGASVIGAVPQIHAEVGPSGAIAPPGGQPPPVRWAVAASDIELRGIPVADAPQQLPGQQGLRLWRLDAPLSFSTQRGGLAPNGDIYGGNTGTLSAFGCVRGDFLATLISKQDQVVEIRRDGTLWRRVPLRSGEIWRGRVPVPPARTPAARAGRRTCTLEVAPTGLLGTTVFLFERHA